MKKLGPIIIISATLSALIVPFLAGAAASEPQPEIPPEVVRHDLRTFCEEPTFFVCGYHGISMTAGDTPTRDEWGALNLWREDRMSFAELEYAALEKNALHHTIQKMGYAPGVVTPENFLAFLKKIDPPLSWWETFADRFDPSLRPSERRILNQHSRRFLNIANAAVVNTGGKIRPLSSELPNFIARVRREVISLILVSDPARVKKITAVNVVKVVTPYDFEKASDDSRLLGRYLVGCGLTRELTGIREKAFFAPELNTLFLCPALFVHTILHQDEPGGLATLKYILAHELAHTMDTGSFALESCIYENATYGWLDEIPHASGPARLVAAPFLQEITADAYGFETLISDIEKIELPTPSDTTYFRLKRIRATLDTFCDQSMAGGSHPSPKFRIEQSMRRNPRLDKLLGCGSVKTILPNYGCTLLGKTSQKY